MKLEIQADEFLDRLISRRRDKAKPSTINAYRSLINSWILPYFGKTDLSEIENGRMRQFVSHLDKQKLSSSTIVVTTGLVKSIISSALDGNGNELYPRKWNNDFMDLPRVDPRHQKNPVLDATGVQETLSRADATYRPFFALLAGTGLRIGESLALKAGPEVAEESRWDFEKGVIYVRKALYRGDAQDPKTQAGVREIDLCPALNEYLRGILDRQEGETLFPVPLGTAYYHAEKANVPGFHSFRRFRVTHLEGAGVPHSLVQFWTGHAGKDITARYTRFQEGKSIRKEWADKAGLGFNL